MSWDRTIDLIYDVLASASTPLLRVEGNSISQGNAPVLIAGDCVNLRIFLRQKNPTTSALDAVSIPSGFAIVFAGKELATGPTGALLFSCTDFVETGIGADLHYAATLNLNTTQLLAAVASASEVKVRCDLQIQNADNSRRYTMQADFTVRNQAYAGEGAPASGDPLYPLPSQIALNEPVDGDYKIEDGKLLKLKNASTGTFESIEARHQSGIVLTIEDGRMVVFVNGQRRGSI
jgi:hypothetical protein